MISGVGLNKCRFRLEAMHSNYHCPPSDAHSAGLRRESCPEAMPAPSEAKVCELNLQLPVSFAMLI